MTSYRVGLGLRHWRDRWQIWRETIEDGRRHRRYSAATDARSALSVGARQIEAQITKDYHRIEKGLTLPRPKSRFGTEVEARLVRDIPRYEAMEGHDPVVVEHAMSALEGLAHWHTNETVPLDGPTKAHRPYNGLPEEQAEVFFRSRASVRDFTDRTVERSLIRRAADLSLSSPSVCNRQAWGLWSFHDRDAIERLASLQNGNAGFREQIPCLLVVTVDTRLFAGSGERNQRWIDGGLYAMTLVWALHSLGVASCMLNWSVDHAQTRLLRRAASIPDHMDIITMIAAGYPREGYRVARSPRRSVDDVLHSDQGD
jgi:nitroreductase